MELAGEVVQAAKLASKKVEDSMQRVGGLGRHPVMSSAGRVGRAGACSGGVQLVVYEAPNGGGLSLATSCVGTAQHHCMPCRAFTGQFQHAKRTLV